MSELILEMTGITKSFPGVKALDNVDFKIYSGEVMALVGENGAGKSTLMKILSGVYKRDSGDIFIRDMRVDFSSPNDAIENGIAIIHQELNLIPDLSVTENIYLGREIKNRFGHLNKREMERRSNELLHSLGIDIKPNEKINNLSIAQQQMVEIAKALSLNAEIIVMDEPTDTLTDKEVRSLFKIIDNLKAQNKGIVYISHRLTEIFEMCERVTVLRDGIFIDDREVKDLTEDEVISLMVGRQIDELFPYVETDFSENILEVNNLSNKYVKDINFELKKGEILGISGLVGAGRTELAKTLYGLYAKDKGEVILNGEDLNITNPKQSLESGIVYVSEDRKHDGLILMMDVTSNITISSLEKFQKTLRLDRGEEKAIAQDYVKKMNIRTPSVNQKVENLSGGNQQKVAIAKALLTNPEVLILDEPTRGVDVGAKKEIYELLNIIKETGKSIIMISSEMPEILGMSDRILVMHNGEVRGSLTRDEADQEKIMNIIMNGEK